MEIPTTRCSHRDDNLDTPKAAPKLQKRMFNLTNMSTPVLAAIRGKARRPPFVHSSSHLFQSESDTDEGSDEGGLGFPRPAYSRQRSKVLDLKKAMLSNLSLADLLTKTKPTNAADRPVTSTSALPTYGNTTATSHDASNSADEHYANPTLGSPIRLLVEDHAHLQSPRNPASTTESSVANPLTLEELRQLRSTANTTFYDARRSRAPQVPSREVSRPVTPLPAFSPQRPETPSLKRKLVPAYLETTLLEANAGFEPYSQPLENPRTPPARFANICLAPEIYANPRASHSLGALRLFEVSPASSEDTTHSKCSSSTFGSIASSTFFSESIASSTGDHCRSSLESVQEGHHPFRNMRRPGDLANKGRTVSSLDGNSPHFVLSVDAPLSERRTSATESLGRRLVSASMSTPVLGHHKIDSTAQPKRSPDGRVAGDNTPRFQFSWRKLRLNL